MGSIGVAIGTRFGRLVVVGGQLVQGRHQRNTQWRCRCDCGTERLFYPQNVRRGLSRSCGCLARELAAEANRTHGGTGTANYARWRNMLQRCNDTTDAAFDSYGGRGIDVCHGWASSFESYRADIGDPPGLGMSIDRIDNNLGYHCGHCLECLCYGQTKNWRWATRVEQARNTRRNQWITVGNETLLPIDWAKRNGISRQLISLRLKNGWDPVRAVTTPADSTASEKARRLGLGKHRRAA